MFENVLAGFADFRRDLRQPDRGLGRLHLAKEGADALKFVLPPVLKQPRGFRRYAPITGIRTSPPLVYLFPNALMIGVGSYR